MTSEILISQLVRDRRTSTGLSQTELAGNLDVALSTIERWEKGSTPPTARQRKKLAGTLGGSSFDYEWSQADFDYLSWLATIKDDNTRWKLILR